jgi:hypothetical protein
MLSTISRRVNALTVIIVYYVIRKQRLSQIVPISFIKYLGATNSMYIEYLIEQTGGRIQDKKMDDKTFNKPSAVDNEGCQEISCKYHYGTVMLFL